MSLDELLELAATHLEAATHDGDTPRKGYEYARKLVTEMRVRASMIRNIQVRMEKPMSILDMIGLTSDMVEVLK